MEYLQEAQEISFLNTLESGIPKIVLLAAASDLENRTQETLTTYYETCTQRAEFAVSFVTNKALKRQFHTFFKWEDRNANQFFGLFGPRFKRKMRLAIEADQALAASIKDFCEIGDLRNQLVHRGYATFLLEKTAAEVYGLYESALYFPDRLRNLLEEEEAEEGAL
ncbi:HEPN domain-containing protein [Micromonospora sp. C41]|uniref:HEPN domain-containing protein n=1 Tax=Micromonospora sp. C41 TaxID=2824878 RepID=UPI0035B101BF